MKQKSLCLIIVADNIFLWVIIKSYSTSSCISSWIGLYIEMNNIIPIMKTNIWYFDIINSPATEVSLI